MKFAVLTALAVAAPALVPALAQTSPSGGIGSLTPPASQTTRPDQAQGPATGQPAPATNPDDRGRPVQAPSSTSSQ
jgi:hypothetical protein